MNDGYIRNSQSKNIEIELLRFFFAFVIMSFHFGLKSQFTGLASFRCGDRAVEFFFILSGLLMARSAQKYLSSVDKNNVGSIVSNTVIRKVKPLFPYVFGSSVIAFFLLYAHDLSVIQSISEFINMIPDYLFIGGGGLHKDTLFYWGIIWYISAMAIAILFLLPLYLLHNNASRGFLFPLITIATLSFLANVGGAIILHNHWVVFTTGGVLRAIGEMSLGAICYDISLKISSYDYTKLGKLLFTGLKLLCFVLVFVFVLGEFPGVWNHGILFVIAGLVVISFSTSAYSLVNGGSLQIIQRIVTYLGKVSMPLFIIHLPLFAIITKYCGSEWVIDNINYVCIFTVIFSMVVYSAVEYTKRKTYGLRKLFIEGDITE